MKNIHKHILILFLIAANTGFAQISPGDLSVAHSEYEGMSNCTLCHELGNNVTDKKCLDCHKEIKLLVDDKKGYHNGREVKAKNCFECHSEHHGRKFNMIRFDEDTFNHKKAGYELEGQHNKIDCRECHISENIQDKELKKRPNTFLGLDNKCLSCHDDYHQKTLDSDCKSCHDMTTFSPASNFDHNQTDYKLKGKHVKTDCVDCHELTQKDGKEYQVFSNIEFKDCNSCHEDLHKNKIPGNCYQCHTEESFSYFKGKGLYDHRVTSFTLKGKHKKINCFECHTKTDNPLQVFQDHKGVNENNCAACHEDTHTGKYGGNCAQCHIEKSFLSLKNMDSFNHKTTNYPLKGQHITVDCKQCHTNRYSEPIEHSECKSCHTDFHRGELTTNGVTTDCIACHSLDKGFNYTLYDIERHQESSFILEGAHIATPCFACHISEKEERWTFKDLGTDCISCHEDIHDSFISKSYYPKNDCKQCHVNESWKAIDFDHNTTNWPLEDRHLDVDCRSCHFSESKDNDIVIQKFINLSTECASCHENVHDESFEIDGTTDCARCHVTSSWIPEKFDHNATQFPLEGKHKDIDCKACHLSYDANGKSRIIYKLNKLACTDCH